MDFWAPFCLDLEAAGDLRVLQLASASLWAPASKGFVESIRLPQINRRRRKEEEEATESENSTLLIYSNRSSSVLLLA